MSAAISVIRNSFISVKFITKLGKTKGKVHHTRYLDGSAAVEQSLGMAGHSYPTSTLPTWAAHLNPCDSLGPSPRQARFVDGAQGREMSTGKCPQGADLWFSPSFRPFLFISHVLLPEQVKLGNKVLTSATLCRGQG